MTERSDPGPTAAQLDRVARLRARRTGTTTPPEPASGTTSVTVNQTDPAAAPTAGRRRRRHPARGGRIVAAGLGATTMLAIVGLLGLDDAAATGNAETGAAPPVVQHPAPPTIRVVVHRIPVARTAAPSQPATSAPDDPDASPAPDEPSAPIVLTARPVVRTVTVDAPSRADAPAPAATTRGSN